MQGDERIAAAFHGRALAPGAVDVEVRRPRPDELTACRLIMPDAFVHGPPELLVAVSRHPRRLRGVLAFRDRSTPGDAVWQMRIHVVAPYRRQGIGRRLVDELRTLALRAGVTRLLTVDASGDPGTAAFLREVRFRAVFRIETFEVDVQAQRPSVASLYDRLAARGRIPDAARVVTLTDAAREPLMALLAAQPGAASAALPARTPLAWSDAWCRPDILRVSPVIVLDDLPIAVVLAERTGTRATVRWRVVAPEHRLGWANILLGHTAFEWMAREGVSTCRFTSTSLTPDTERMARVHAMAPVECVDHYCLDMHPEGPIA